MYYVDYKSNITHYILCDVLNGDIKQDYSLLMKQNFDEAKRTNWMLKVSTVTSLLTTLLSWLSFLSDQKEEIFNAVLY